MDLRRFSIVVLFATGSAFLTLRTIAVSEDTAKPNSGTPQVNSQVGSLSLAEAKKLKNPVPFATKSIAQGRTIFVRNCTLCHGPDGKAMVDVVSNATDLTSPKLWRNGTTEGEIFRAIRDGAGDSMPAFKSQIHQEEDLWHLVNFIRSLWPASMRPALLETEAGEPPANKSK